MTGPLHLRPAAEADLSAIAEVYRGASLHWDDTREWLLERPAYLEIDGDDLLARLTTVAVRDGVVLGFASCTEPVGGRSELEDLFVLPDRMGGGVGRELVAAVAARALAAGATILDVTANANALGFYEAVGFVTVGRADTPGGPAPRMALTLDSSRPRSEDAGMSAEARLVELGIELPADSPPAGLYAPAVTSGDLVYLSGSGPARPGRGYVTGKVGLDEGGTVSLEEARFAARLTGLQLLTRLRAEIGSLDRVVRVVKVLGMVNGAPGFHRTPAVIDGCSELFIEVFGEAGRAARSAIGVAELPFDICVEIEAIVQIRP